ncbi:MAG: hypothetical protein K0S11_615 [Gammaproteobacteria bacterium]|jgi:hypothetical protein|nr:hypothetical protein [Gammaproteobacteria bacterium]
MLKPAYANVPQRIEQLNEFFMALKEAEVLHYYVATKLAEARILLAGQESLGVSGEIKQQLHTDIIIVLKNSTTIYANPEKKREFYHKNFLHDLKNKTDATQKLFSILNSGKLDFVFWDNLKSFLADNLLNEYDLKHIQSIYQDLILLDYKNPLNRTRNSVNKSYLHILTTYSGKIKDNKRKKIFIDTMAPLAAWAQEKDKKPELTTKGQYNRTFLLFFLINIMTAKGYNIIAIILALLAIPSFLAFFKGINEAMNGELGLLTKAFAEKTHFKIEIIHDKRNQQSIKISYAKELEQANQVLDNSKITQTEPAKPEIFTGHHYRNKLNLEQSGKTEAPSNDNVLPATLTSIVEKKPSKYSWFVNDQKIKFPGHPNIVPIRKANLSDKDDVISFAYISNPYYLEEAKTHDYVCHNKGKNGFKLDKTKAVKNGIPLFKFKLLKADKGERLEVNEVIRPEKGGFSLLVMQNQVKHR